MALNTSVERTAEWVPSYPELRRIEYLIIEYFVSLKLGRWYICEFQRHRRFFGHRRRFLCLLQTRTYPSGTLAAADPTAWDTSIWRGVIKTIRCLARATRPPAKMRSSPTNRSCTLTWKRCRFSSVACCALLSPAPAIVFDVEANDEHVLPASAAQRIFFQGGSDGWPTDVTE